jgi:hypothetical protein
VTVEDDGPPTKGSVRRASVPFVIVAAILVLIGVILVIKRPLPRIIPALN